MSLEGRTSSIWAELANIVAAIKRGGARSFQTLEEELVKLEDEKSSLGARFGDVRRVM